MMENKRSNILAISLVILAIVSATQSIKTIKSFKELGEHHCSEFPIETIWRVASGMVSEKHGEQYFDFDCYIRQFVRTDGLAIGIQGTDDDEESDDQDAGEQKLAIDPIVTEYSQGLQKCLPSGVDAELATYQIWRFFRYMIQHDYVYEWMRAKIRATLGYESERPNAWMDGDNDAPRLRLDKLFSNQFYEYLDTLMFKDYLYPLLTFLKENTVIAISGKAAEGGKPIIFQSLQTKNIIPKFFEPVIFELPGTKKQIFSYTIPGIPLLLGGSSSEVAWSFTGILVDRSNIEEIETVGMKFYNHDTEEWLKLSSEEVAIPGVQDKVCKFIHSPYGPMYAKVDRAGKNQEYIVKWHEKENKVRKLFTQLFNFIIRGGHLEEQETLEFPFNSIVFANDAGIFQYICQQEYPSYFLYPDMFGEPQKITQRLFSYPSKKMIVVSNSRLTSAKQQGYQKGDPQSTKDELILSQLKSQKSGSLITLQSLLTQSNPRTLSSPLKRQKDTMIKIYRKVKFLYLPDQQHRKKCDQLVAMLEKWNNQLDDTKLAPIFVLWNYFVKHYTFNFVSVSKFGSQVVKHWLLTENYWAGQMKLWEVGTGYGECESSQYESMKHEVSGTGQNSSCFLNVIRAFNTTKDILTLKYDGDYSKINLRDFTDKKMFENMDSNQMGNDVEQAFGVYYSESLKFVAQVDNPNIIYYNSQTQSEQQVSLSPKQASEVEQQL